MKPARNIADSNPYEPPKEVLDYLRRKGLKPIWDWRDAWRQEHQVAFTVAGVMELDILEDIRTEVTRALQKGLPFQQFKKVIEPILADKGWLARKTVADPITGEKKDVELGKPGRLQTIFETNINSARAAGQWGRIQSVKDALPYLRYVHGPSRVPRPDHLALDGIILPADHPFWRTHYPPNGFGCFLGGTKIQGEITGCSKAFYSGEAIELKTAGGQRLTVTPNHPIATTQGLIAAKNVCKGVYCLTHQGEVELDLSVGTPNQARRAIRNQKTPISVEDIFSALRIERGFSRGFTYTPLDFHGEADKFVGEIEVVGSYVELMNQRRLGVLSDLAFALKYTCLQLIAPGRHKTSFFPRPFSTPSGDIGAFRQSLFLLYRHFIVSALLGGRARSGFDTTLSQPTIDNSSCDAEIIRKFKHRFPGVVSTDKIVDVCRFNFSGHVYDFETSSNLILANDILTSNCLCSVRQISAREARSLGGVSPDPDVSPVRWENSRTGQVEYVPRGVDPGFDYNVGIDRMGGF